MGVFLSVIVASVGAMDLINCLAYVTNTLTAGPAAAGSTTDEDLERYRRLLQEQIENAPKVTIEGLTRAQDGVTYKDGYRVERFDDARLDQLNVKIRELERKSQEKDQLLDRLNVQLQELERKSTERELVIGELRSRTVSRVASPEPSSSLISSLAGEVPAIVLVDDDQLPGSSNLRPIHRDDEFRRTIKKRSVASNVSEDRTDELEMLTHMEEEEAQRMEDYAPLVYAREEQMKKRLISPIQELCPMHEDEDRGRMILERSPEPSFGADVVKPWGDIKLEETKEKGLIHLPEEFNIQEETRDSDSSVLEDADSSTKNLDETNEWLQSPRNTFPEVVQPTIELTLLPSSGSVPSNLSSHSNSPDPEQPPLKRTRKKSDLTALLLEEERKSGAFSTVIITAEESDSDHGERSGFMQSRSPSPFVGPFLEHEQLHSTGQLIPLVQEELTKPSTPDQEQPSSLASPPLASTSRDATISPAPIASSGSPTSPISSIVDEYVKDGPCQIENGSRSPTADRNVSRDGSVSLASAEEPSAGSLDLHVDRPTPSPSPSPLPSSPLPPPIQQQTMATLDAGGADRKSKSPSPAPAPRRFRTKKRIVRSVTPINFDQTFMDQFSEQHFCVSPSELEDYINSQDEIKGVPPQPVTPNYFIPTTPMTSGVPSLLLTDEKGEDARFHDSLSSKSFYGANLVDPARVLNHRVSYTEWIKKFPDSMTSHLELEDYDSDDEEVENIISGLAKAVSPEPETENKLKFPVEVTVVSVSPSPDPLNNASKSPEISTHKSPEARTEFPLNLDPSYATPSPVSQVSDVSLSTESIQDSSSFAMGSPLLNSVPSPATHFTPIASPLSSLKSPTPDHHSLSPHPVPKLFIPSRSPSLSPIPPDMTPEEAIFDIGHLDGLIFETRSRSPTPLPQTPSVQLSPLSPEELAYDIGNLGGLIIGPPSRSASPLPASPSPTPLGSSTSSWSSLQQSQSPSLETNGSSTTTNTDNAHKNT